MSAEPRPIITRLPEALEAEREAIAAAYGAEEAERIKRETAETDAERLARESQ